MNILVITRSAWRNDNSTGNTMSNILSGFENDHIYSLCFRSEQPENDIIEGHFSISESQIIRHFMNKAEVGKIWDCKQSTPKDDLEKRMYVAAKKHKIPGMALIRELIWDVAPYKNNNLRNYLDEIKPDIIFMATTDGCYMYKVLKYIKQYTNAKLVLFHSDDKYTLKQFIISPFFWIYRINLRKWVGRSIKSADINYVISDIQKDEYTKFFDKEFKILYKGNVFDEMPETNSSNNILKLVFTGNINVGRYKSLAKIGQALKIINKDEIKAQLDIYTQSVITKKMKKALDIPGCINLLGPVSSEEVKKIQENADILVHVESFDLKNKLIVHQSFSTKIVDYLHQAKCILAVGPKDVASMDYLIKNNAALTATNTDEIAQALQSVIDDKNVLSKYGRKAWECGKKNHQIDKIQSMLYNDFRELVDKN